MNEIVRETFSDSVQKARAIFPSGLSQPQGSYRFGLEALLLAAAALNLPATRNAGKIPARRIVDLGSGCGASLLALALSGASILGLGLDVEPELALHARDNAAMLGLANLSFLTVDLYEKPAKTMSADWLRHTDIVLANPPWRPPDSGRLSPQPKKRLAHTDAPGLLARFTCWARELLDHKGYFIVILPADRLIDFLPLAHASQLGLRAILPLVPFSGQDARCALLQFQKDSRACPVIKPALILHGRKAGGISWTLQARKFCPWLQTADKS